MGDPCLLTHAFPTTPSTPQLGSVLLVCFHHEFWTVQAVLVLVNVVQYALNGPSRCSVCSSLENYPSLSRLSGLWPFKRCQNQSGNQGLVGWASSPLLQEGSLKNHQKTWFPRPRAEFGWRKVIDIMCHGL